MSMYAKLFTSIYQGTLRGNSNGLLVFTNLLAHCDKNGIADIHPKAIAEEVGLTIEQVKAALEELESPDIESRSPEEDGKRIVRMDEHRAWGWLVVNYVKYRAIRNEDDRREQNRASQERYRNRHKPQSAKVSQDQPQSAHTEAEAYTEEKKAPSARAVALPRPQEVSEQTWADWITLRKAKKAPVTKTVLRQAGVEANKAGLSLEAFLGLWCARGSQGLEASWLKPEDRRMAAQLTAPSKAAAETRAYLDGRASQPKTKPPESVMALVNKMRTGS